MEAAELERIFSELGDRYGLGKTTARFDELREIEITWTRKEGQADFRVCDYLEDAPHDVIRSIAETVIARIAERYSEYEDVAIDYLSSEGFRMRNKETYLERIGGLSEDAAGKHADLRDAYERLIARGMIERDPELDIRWSSACRKKVGHVSGLMRIAVVSARLDREDVPEETLDYALYRLLSQIEGGFPPKRHRWSEFSEKLNRFENREAAEDNIRMLGMRY